MKVDLIELEQFPNMKFLEIKRVSYGRKDTPEGMREYRASAGGPVGTIKEWVDFIKQNPSKKIEGLLAIDHKLELALVYNGKGELITTSNDWADQTEGVPNE